MVSEKPMLLKQSTIWLSSTPTGCPMITRLCASAKPRHYLAGEFTVANKPYPSNTKSTPENPTGWQLIVEHHRPHDRPTVFSKPYSLPPKISNSLAANQISAVDSWMTSSCKCDRPLAMHEGILIGSYANATRYLNPVGNREPGPQNTNPH